MRQLTIVVPKGYGKQILKMAADCDSYSQVMASVENLEQPLEQVTVLLPNRKVGNLLAAVEAQMPHADVALPPSAVLALHLPSEEIPTEMGSVQPRSPLEVFLQGVQSIGSWPSFLTYAAVAGVIVWIGMYTNSVFLLVAAMLIAPFGGPAMNVAIASARGDLHLLKNSLARYFAALGVVVTVTGILSMLFQQTIATSQMISTSEVSSTAILLPLAGGVAGALQLVQSERSSLVSGTAIGMLVAAALAPPAGLMGMAIAIGQPQMAVSGIFLLLLQLAGINLSCSILFRIYALKPGGAVYARGKRSVFPIALGLTTLAIALLLSWQFSNAPNLTRESQSQRAVAVIQKVIDNDPAVSLVESNARFTRANIEDQNTLLSTIYVQPKAGQTLAAEATSRRLTTQIQNELLNQGFNVTPLINITVLEPPQ
ncbi:MAG: putative membrane protein [Phormidesmis priestleyi Ana]|uniref:Putative membrane protein n=1 Tax=Phormidesmis priestleyi Ana TaxID=1666911 RepID=A0A0N8KNF6_9CYAN|nr:MAG: putative membrane protein [Phormidesmis priestleyi Ana]